MCQYQLDLLIWRRGWYQVGHDVLGCEQCDPNRHGSRHRTPTSLDHLLLLQELQELVG